MKRQILLLCILLCVPLWLCAAQTKKKFSKKYRDTRLEQVLNDVCKRYDYQLVADPADIDMDKRITYTFKNATPGNVLRRVLDKDLTYKIRKGKIFITRKPLPPEVYTVVAQTPTSTEENDSLQLTVWTDTVYSVTCRTVTKEQTSGGTTASAQPKSGSKQKGKGKSAKQQPAPEYKGHHLFFSLGGAYADLGYSLRDADHQRVGRSHGSAGGMAQLQYAYFFDDHWGLAAGVGFSHYTSYGTLNHTKRYAGQTDTDGESYTHLAVTRDWRERQAAYMLDIPVEALYHHPLNESLGLYAGLGVKAGLILAADRRLRSGALEHQGEYGPWGLTLADMDEHGFYTEQVGTDFPTDRQSLSLRLPAIGVMADLGLTIRLTDRVNLLTGVFFNYTCNNVRTAATAEMGWQQSTYTGEQAYRNHDFMTPYGGMVESEYVSAVRPWEVGLKIGIDWRHQPKPKAKEPEVEYIRVQVCDTAVTYAQRVDTVVKPRQAVHEIVRLMETSVIWYDLDSSTPKLKPADILDRIAAILIANPDQRILINGHASKEGTALHNKRLSESRAKVIYDMLLEKGVRAEQMTPRGFGVEKSYQEGEHEISLDRRVEIIPINE